MKSSLQREKDNSIVITIILPWADVQKAYNTAVSKAIESIEVKGFRKGKAPREIAEKQLDKNRVFEVVIKEEIPKAYTAAISEHKLNPIVTPDVKLVSAKEGEDWTFTAITCERPTIALEGYKTTVIDIKGDMKKDELIIPGKSDGKPESDETAIQKKQRKINHILEHLIKKIEIVIPSVLIQGEVDQRMSRLIDELKKLGLTIDTYAKSKNMTPKDIRIREELEVTNTFKLEFILEYIADAEKIVVEDSDITTMANKISDKGERDELLKNKYYIANLMRRQKTLDRLLVL